MSTFQPVPTYQDPVDVNPRTGKSAFNPTWLSWFISLASSDFTASQDHNTLSGLQGGQSEQYYHLTQTEHSTIPFRSSGTAPAGITVGASPFSFANSHAYDEDVIVKGGTVSKVEFGRGASFFDVGVVAGMFHLSPGDTLRVTYTVVPTMTEVPR